MESGSMPIRKAFAFDTPNWASDWNSTDLLLPVSGALQKGCTGLRVG